jgi:hypothetical protein
MNRAVDPDLHEKLCRYVLDELSDEERDGLEQKLLQDASLQDDLLTAIEGVADDFARGILSEERRRMLAERYGGDPEWEEAVEFARTMHTIEPEVSVSSAARGERSRRPWMRFPIFALAALAVVLLAVWTIEERPPKAKVVSGVPVAPVASWVLELPVLKGSPAQQDHVVTLPEIQGPIEIRMPLDRDVYNAYRVELQATDSGKSADLGEVRPVRRNGSAEVTILVDSARFRLGRYTIVLRAAEVDGRSTDVAGYSFRVVPAH